MSSSPRLERLKEVELDYNPLKRVSSHILTIIKTNYPNALPVLLGKRAIEAIEQESSKGGNGSNNLSDSNSDSDNILPLPTEKQADFNKVIDALVNQAKATKKRESTAQNTLANDDNGTPFAWIPNPNNTDTQLAKSVKAGKISPRAALFGWLLINSPSNHSSLTFLMGLLLRHSDNRVQKTLDTLSPVARSHLAKHLLSKYERPKHYDHGHQNSQQKFSHQNYQYVKNKSATTNKTMPLKAGISFIDDEASYQFINPWQDIELLPVLWQIYPTFKAKLLPKVWADTWLRPYQTGYSRRSFRHPNNSCLLTYNALDTMRDCSELPWSYQNESASFKNYALTMEDGIRFGSHSGVHHGLNSDILAAALDLSLQDSKSQMASTSMSQEFSDVFALCKAIPVRASQLLFDKRVVKQ